MSKRDWKKVGKIRWTDFYAPVGLIAFLYMILHDQTERPWLMAGCLALMGISPVMRADERRRNGKPRPGEEEE